LLALFLGQGNEVLFGRQETDIPRPCRLYKLTS
jgi:hypothetical protein